MVEKQSRLMVYYCVPQRQGGASSCSTSPVWSLYSATAEEGGPSESNALWPASGPFPGQHSGRLVSPIHAQQSHLLNIDNHETYLPMLRHVHQAQARVGAMAPSATILHPWRPVCFDDLPPPS